MSKTLLEAVRNASEEIAYAILFVASGRVFLHDWIHRRGRWRLDCAMSKPRRCAAPEVQWTMNFCLAGIGIHFPKLSQTRHCHRRSLGALS